MANTNWKVKNETSKIKKNLVVIDASVDSYKPKSFYYEQKMTLLAPSSTDTFVTPDNFFSVTIPNVHTDADGGLLPYTFIIAEAETLAPVTALSFKADLSDLSELAVTDDMVTHINNVLEFHKNITAFPASGLATDFAAIDTTDTKAVDTFFANTLDYQNVTLGDWQLIRSYYKALPYGWAHGKNTTIYLYGGDYKNNTESARPLGTIAITNDWSKPLPVTPSDQFKIELKLNGEATRKLAFSKGVFWDTVTSDTHKISLAGTFIMPSQLTQDNSQNEIVTCVVGSINGYDAFGLENVAPDDQDSDAGFYDLFNIHNFKEGVDVVLYFIAIGLAIEFLVHVGHFVKWAKNYGKKTTDQREREQQTEELKQYVRENNQALARQVNPQIRVPQQAELPGNQAQQRQRMLDLNTRQAKANVQKMVEAQYAELEALSGKYVNGDTGTAMDHLDTIQRQLDTNSLAEFRGNLEVAMVRIRINHTTITTGKNSVNARLTDAERNAYEESVEAYNRANALQEVNDRARTEIEEMEDAREVDVEAEA